MVVISPAQMQAFQHLAEQQFVDELDRLLREEADERFLAAEPEELRARITSALADGKRFGMKTRGALADFVRLALDYGPSFARHPRVARVLADPSIPPDDRVDALFLKLSDRIWEELAILSGAESWDEGEEIANA